MRAVISLSLLSLVAGCGSSALEVSDAWARSSPAVADTAAFYLTITNESGAGRELINAESDRCISVEIHETTMDGDVMAMRRLDALELPAGETIRLEPGGLHLMCLGVGEALVEGDTFAVILNFRAGAPLPVEVDVEDR